MGLTLDYYDKNYMHFYEDTVAADVSDLRARFTTHIPRGGSILDFGCGSGRDSKAFISEGYSVTAIDGSQKLCKIASDYIGKKVRCMDFLELQDQEKYDGIWACASVLHVEKSIIPQILVKMMDAIVDGGIIYLSFKYGNYNGTRNGRHFTDLNESSFRDILLESNANSNQNRLVTLEEWVSKDSRRDNSTAWLNELLTKKAR